MKIPTELISATPEAIQKAAKLLLDGQVVAIPTETVYGLAANAMDTHAVSRVFEAKGRPSDNPLIVHIDSLEMVAGLAKEFPLAAQKLAEAFWPGSLTIVLPSTPQVPRQVTAGLATVGVRMPAHATALAVISAAGVPLAAPSANLSGSPSPTTAWHVLEDLSGRIPLILDGGACAVGLESTVLSLVGEITILRPGFVTKEEIEQVLGQKVCVADSIASPLQEGQKPASPGMKYAHYAPKAEITIVCGGFEQFRQYVSSHKGAGVFALCFAGEEPNLPVSCIPFGQEMNETSQAETLFAALRALDAQGAKKVYARCPSQQGVGLAVYNRLLRAAAFRVITV